MNSKAIGMKLHELRLKKKKTQIEVARELGISQSAYCMYESGQKIPSDKVKIKIADYFGKTVGFIFYSHEVNSCEQTN